MPKGGLLHAHLDATVNTRVLLCLALKYPAFHVRTDVRLTAENISTTLPEFSPLKETEWTTLKSLSDDTYAPGSWVPLASARETFDSALGGPEGFDNWVIAALTINPTEAYHTHNTTDKVKNITFCLARNSFLLLSDLAKVSIYLHCDPSRYPSLSCCDLENDSVVY